MAGCSSSAGGIRVVMETNDKTPHKVKSDTGTKYKTQVKTIQVDDNTYYLYKGDSIELDGHQYFTQVPSTIGLANMMLLAWNTRLLIALLMVVK
jgi:hypothetical protein